MLTIISALHVDDAARLAASAARFALSPQACGYFASLLVFATFWMQRMLPLRVVAICSNIAFFIYGVWLGLMPIAILHACLLPINIWRCWQLHQAARPPATHGAPKPPLRYFAEAAIVLALSFTFVGGAVSSVTDSGIHCPIEGWRDWSPVCRHLAERALAGSPAFNEATRTIRPAADAPARLSTEQVDKLIAAARTNPHGRRDSLMILLAYRHRLKPSALLRLKWRDLRADGTLRVPMRPSSARRLTADEVREFRRLEGEPGHRSAFIFTSASGRPISRARFARVVRRAGREAALREPISAAAVGGR